MRQGTGDRRRRLSGSGLAKRLDAARSPVTVYTSWGENMLLITYMHYYEAFFVKCIVLFCDVMITLLHGQLHACTFLR